MQIVRDLAGYSWGRSDLVRRAMAKKKHEVMAKEREYFINGIVQDGKVVVPGAVRNGVDRDTANRIFDEMMDFASYAFNKSHAAGYAVVAYQTAYLKCHYPCEYMAALLSSVLGQTGKNFAAGMTGGIAYVLDENWDFYQRVNKETVSLEPVEHKYDVATLKELIREHVELTGSPRGKEILDNFSEFLPKFKKVLPYDYDRMLRVIASVEERGLDGEQAQIEAFYTVQKNK